MNENIEIVIDDGSNRVVIWRNVFVHVRRGPQTMQSLDLLVGTWRSLKRTVDGEIFVLSIIAADAGTADAAVGKRRAAVVREVFGSRRVRSAVVIEGEGILADLRRIMVRGVADSRTKIFGDAWDAARMLAGIPGAPNMAELLAVIDVARKRDG